MIEPLQTVGSTYHPDRPPADTATHVTLDKAVTIVGNTVFANGWTGERDARWEEVTDILVRAFESKQLTPGYLLSNVQMSMAAMSHQQASGAAGWFSSNKFRPWGASDAWIFVTRKSLDGLVYELTRHEREGTSSAFEYSMNERRWRLFDAAVWIATAGHPTTTGAIAVGRFEDVGCRILFDKLDELGFDAPPVSGLLPLLQRRVDLHLSWERVHTGWLGSEGHRVRFYPTEGDQIAADLVEHQHTEPGYVDLRIDRDALIQLFPKREVPADDSIPLKSGGPRTGAQISAEAAFEDHLFGLMDAKPKEPISNAVLQKLAKTDWGLGREAYRRARGKALERGKGRFVAWTEGGDAKKYRPQVGK